MKLSRRRAAVPEVAAQPEAPDAPAHPADVRPPGAPAAVFAGLLDGQRLWVAVDARPGRLALRPAATTGGPQQARAVLPLVDEANDDQPAYLGARLDLGPLTSNGAAVYDVVVVAPGAEPLGVWTPPLTTRKNPPTTAHDDVTVFRLERDPAGFLQVRAGQVRRGATLLSCKADLDGIELIVGRADAPASHLALVAKDGSLLVSYDATPEVHDGQDVLRAHLTAAPADDVAPQVGFIVVGEPGRWQRIRRLDNDLGEPRRSVSLPRVEDPETGEPRLRLRWSNSAILQGRLLDPGEETDGPDGPDDDTTPEGPDDDTTPEGPDAADPADQEAGR